MKALAYAFSAENPHALRNILLVAQEEPLTSKLHTCRPRTEETHTDPKVS